MFFSVWLPQNVHQLHVSYKCSLSFHLTFVCMESQCGILAGYFVFGVCFFSLFWCFLNIFLMAHFGYLHVFTCGALYWGHVWVQKLVI